MNKLRGRIDKVYLKRIEKVVFWRMTTLIRIITLKPLSDDFLGEYIPKKMCYIYYRKPSLNPPISGEN